MDCNKCGSEMELIDMPQEIFTIPFTNGRYSIWDYNKKDWYCHSCVENSERDAYDAMAAGIGEEAYNEGFNDGQDTQRSRR